MSRAVQKEGKLTEQRLRRVVKHKARALLSAKKEKVNTNAQYPLLSNAMVSASVCSYLVDPASSHMLVSKIKPCMCKYKH